MSDWKKRFYEKQKKGETEEVEKKDARSQAADDVMFSKYQNLKLSGEIKEGFALYFKNFPLLILIFCGLALIIAVLSVLIFTNIDWQLASEYDAFKLLVGETPQEEWTEEQIAIYMELYNRITMLGFTEALFKFIPFVLSGMMGGYFLITKIREIPPVRKTPPKKEINNEKYRSRIILIIMQLVYFIKDIIRAIFFSIKEYAKRQKDSIPVLKTSVIKIFKNDKLRPTILHTIILTIMISFGLSFLLIPGFLFIMALGFMFFIIPEYKEKLLNYPRLAYMLGENHRLRTFILAILGYAFYAFFGYILGGLATWFYTQELYIGILDPATRNYWFLLYFEVTELVIPALFQPLLFCFLAVQYVEIQIKKEIALGDLTSLLTVKAVSEPAEKTEPLVKYTRSEKKNIAKVIQQKDKEPRYYCPGCGQRVLPTAKQTTVRCKNCDLEVHIPK